MAPRIWSVKMLAHASRIAARMAQEERTPNPEYVEALQTITRILESGRIRYFGKQPCLVVSMPPLYRPAKRRAAKPEQEAEAGVI